MRTASSIAVDLRALRTRVAAIDPAVMEAEACASLVGELAAVGKACDAARARLAARAELGGAHRRRGFVDAADWLATEAGVSSTQARRELDTAVGVEQCPQTREALSAGEVSLAQASEIAKTESARRGSEAELLDTARRATLRVLKHDAQRRRLEGLDPDELARRQHRARHFRRWRDDLGMLRFAGALGPIEGTAFLSRLDARTEQLRRAARREGEEESWEAHAADALVELGAEVPDGAGAKSPKSPTRAEVVLVCDINALRRGHATDGEPCHVVGAGPVPVSAVRDALDHDAFLKVAFHDGVSIHKIKHFGRHLKAELRTALELGPPPLFDGKQCGCGCGKRFKVQVDHIDPVANGGPTSMANLNPLVANEHAAKTERDRAAGLLRRRKKPDPPMRTDGRDPP
jgi:hypothetical protein